MQHFVPCVTFLVFKLCCNLRKLSSAWPKKTSCDFSIQTYSMLLEKVKKENKGNSTGGSWSQWHSDLLMEKEYSAHLHRKGTRFEIINMLRTFHFYTFKFSKPYQPIQKNITSYFWEILILIQWWNVSTLVCRWYLCKYLTFTSYICHMPHASSKTLLVTRFPVNVSPNYRWIPRNPPTFVSNKSWQQFIYNMSALISLTLFRQLISEVVDRWDSTDVLLFYEFLLHLTCHID